MRSVFIYLRGATDADVAEYLNWEYLAQADQWIDLRDGDTVLYIRLWAPDLEEIEPDEWAGVCDALTGPPTASVFVNVSGRHDGSEEVRRLVSGLLAQSEGVAQDEYTAHPWTAGEIAVGLAVKGHPFFDFHGWYDELYRDRDLRGRA